MSKLAQPACFHCGLPVLVPGTHRAAVLGAPREFCCLGCESVARAIVAGGHSRYYETRDVPQDGAGRTPVPQDLPPVEVYDDPAAQRQFVVRAGEHEREVTLILDRITCAACIWLSESCLRQLPGVIRASVNSTTRRAQVRWDERTTGLGSIIEAIRAIGYDAYPWDPVRQDRLERVERRRAAWRLFVAGFGAMQVMMYAIPAYIDGGLSMSAESEGLMRWASLVLTLPVLLIACRPFFDSAWRELRLARIGLDTPIALGILGGFLASAWATVAGGGEVYYDSISMLVFLLLLARWVESAARQRAGRELDRILRWMPSVALRMPDPSDAARLEKVAAHDLAAGDHVLVPPGERVPADGTVLSGESGVDESLLTGESRPVAKAAGAPLTGGSVNLEQALVMRVTRAGGDTAAAAIGRLVDRAAASRPEVLSGADRLARWLTVVVIVAATGAALAWSQFAPERALWIAVAVLVVTCPCALALAAPIALTAASARLLRHGIVLTRARAVQALSRATDVVLDKTGPLTHGGLALAATRLHGSRVEAECRARAQAIEASSRHPLARAFRAVPGAALPPVAGVTQFPGHGVEAFVDGVRTRIGGQAFCEELAGPRPAGSDAAPGEAPATEVHLADERGWLATFTLEDRLRDDAAALVQALAARGLRVHLVSGDREEVVASLAGRLGIAAHAGGRAPQDKLAYVEALQREGRSVVMIGDGLNDAPVLARADASIAVAGGADAAQLQADLVVLGGRIGEVAAAFGIAGRTMRIIRQNLGWALAWNAIALPLAMAGFIGPWEAAVGMAASSVIVVVNALRVFERGPAKAPWKASTSSFLSRSRSFS